MELKDYYSIMGVKRTDDLKTIKTAYRRLARKYHPDVGKEPNAEARFKEIAEAWAVLSDKENARNTMKCGSTEMTPILTKPTKVNKATHILSKGLMRVVLMTFSSMFSQRTRGGTRQARSHRGQDLS